MDGTSFREYLNGELAARQRKNRRYSLRAFAAFLESDHSTLSQILRGRRRVPLNRIRSWGKKLGMGQEEIAWFVAAESVPNRAAALKQEALQEWAAEGAGIATQAVHWQILRLSQTPEFRADCRWIAKQIDAPVDEVNLALSRLLRLRLLEMKASNQWADTTGLQPLTERDFRTLALARVRESATEKQTSPCAKASPEAR
ncbi:MAG TPA: DUF4423 domain-containing protein [Candidatus Acidoferrales bacterium]|nr:DUF4423 domain-containing protein [Candidatus Acidoferrales bacterium]